MFVPFRDFTATILGCPSPCYLMRCALCTDPNSPEYMMRESLIRMGKQLIVKFMAWKNIPCPMFSNSWRCLLGTINPTGI